MDENNKGLTSKGVKLVEEVRYGMYVWETPDGEVLGDGDGNIMNVFCMKGDRKAIAALSDAARSYGFPEGKPVWWSGRRRINDEQLQEQEARARMGLVPDVWDVPAMADELKDLKRNG